MRGLDLVHWLPVLLSHRFIVSCGIILAAHCRVVSTTNMLTFQSHFSMDNSPTGLFHLSKHTVFFTSVFG